MHHKRIHVAQKGSAAGQIRTVFLSVSVTAPSDLALCGSNSSHRGNWAWWPWPTILPDGSAVAAARTAPVIGQGRMLVVKGCFGFSIALRMKIELDLAADGGGKCRNEPIIVGLRNRIEFVIVAAGEPTVRPNMAVPTVAAISSNSS